MPDREKVIKGLEMCLASIDEAECPEECPYYETCRNYENRVIFQPVMRDTLELLKEQEPIAPDYRQVLVGSNGAFVLESHCGACGCGIMKNDRWRTKYCPECGKKVKWDE